MLPEPGCGVRVNVRCPNCSAVFPVGPTTPGEIQQVECPLCLLRFQPNAETTVSMPEMPAQLRGTAAPSPDDEFESFGAPTQGATRPFAAPAGGFAARPFGAGEVRTTTFPPAAPPVAPLTSVTPETSRFDPPPPAALGGHFADDNIDFEALLGDTLAPASSAPADASPFGRLSAPRSGNTEMVRESFGPFGAPTATPSFSAAPRQGLSAFDTPIAEPFAAPQGGLNLDALGDLSVGPTLPPADFGLDEGFGGFGGFGDPHATTAPLSSVTPAASADEGGFAGFAGLDASMGPRHAGRDEDSVVVAVTAGAEEANRPTSQRPIGRAPVKSKPKFKLTAETKQYIQRALTAVVLSGLAVALIGAGFEAAGFGWFGRRLWAKPDAGTQRTVQAAKLAAAAQDPPLALWDTRSSYEGEIRRLESLVKRSPKDPKANQALVDRYLDLYERFPLRFVDTPSAKTGLEACLKLVPAPVRLDVIKTIAAGTKVEEDKLAELASGTPDDQALGIRQSLLRLERKFIDDVLAKPGATGGGEADAVRVALKDSPELAELRKRMAAIATAAKGQPNFVKFQVLQAQLADRANAQGEISALVDETIRKADDNAEARILAASAQMETGNLNGADGLLHDALEIADREKLTLDKRAALLTQARLAAKRGDRDKLIAALQAAVDLQPNDEMTVVRLGRLLVADKRADDAKRVLSAAKQAGMQSIAFEVALVEFWLYSNRNEDALEELGAAAKLYPESLDLLFLRAQVEDKSAHFATARDLLAQVIQRDPKHLRAILRLAELLATAEKHDEALATLTASRKAVGDDETLLRLTVEELVALKRDVEAREVAGRLLEIAPDNRAYLLSAAQLDLRLGQVDRGLGYLRKLRDMRMLDRDAAFQMGLALQSKGNAEEAAKTVLPFAEQAQEDVELNVLAGKLLLDSHDADRAGTVLQRAVTAANGKSAEAFFEYGRLAFARGDNESGIVRIKQAIAAEPTTWRFRLTLAQNLFDAKKPDKARELALVELEAIVSAAPALKSAGHAVTEMHTVYGLLARHYSDQHRYPQAAQYWRKVVELKPDDIDALTSLGEALHQAASPDALGVLKQVIKRRPNDARAALYLGLGELNLGHTADALHWLEQATSGTTAETSEAWYHIALIKRERAETMPALKAVEEYLKRAPKDATYRSDALTLRAALKANAQH